MNKNTMMGNVAAGTVFSGVLVGSALSGTSMPGAAVTDEAATWIKGGCGGVSSTTCSGNGNCESEGRYNEGGSFQGNVSDSNSTNCTQKPNTGLSGCSSCMENINSCGC